MLDSSGDMANPQDVNTTAHQLIETVGATSYEPQTKAYTNEVSNETEVYFTPRGPSSQSTLKFSEQARLFNASTISTTTGPASNDDVGMLVTVGVTCGIVGIILGVIISVAFWVYKTRENVTKEPRIAMEKNPQEKTFEPLDLSLTLPSYEPSLHSTRRQHSSLGFHSGDFARPEQRHYRLKDMHNSYKLPPTSASNPVIHNVASSKYPSENYLSKSSHKSFHDRQHPKSRKTWDKTASLDNRVLRHNATNLSNGPSDMENGKLPVSISTRESFSSGLGTCTESEVCSFESRSQPTPSDSEPKTSAKVVLASENIENNRNFSNKQKSALAQTYLNQMDAPNTATKNDNKLYDATRSTTSTLAYDDKMRDLKTRYGRNQTKEDFSKPYPQESSLRNSDSESDSDTDSRQYYKPHTPSRDSSKLKEPVTSAVKDNNHNEIAIIRRNSDVTIDL